MLVGSAENFDASFAAPFSTTEGVRTESTCPGDEAAVISLLEEVVDRIRWILDELARPLRGDAVEVDVDIVPVLIEVHGVLETVRGWTGVGVYPAPTSM